MTQNIPRAAALFCLDIERFCRETAGVDLARQSIVVAYSGGADSKALLLALHFLARKRDITLHAAILDHMFRPEARMEVVEAETLCNRLGISFHTARRDVAALAERLGIGFEEAGRHARREFLEGVRSETHSAWIAFGHQLNDLAEDTLMRNIRGAGWPALGGMAAVLPDRSIIRPLLLTPRAAIESFLTALGEPWVDDMMNTDDAYFRNRVRKRLLPAFLEENPSFLDAVAERWRMAREDAAFFRPLLEAIPTDEMDGGTFLARNELLALPASLRLRKYLDALSALGEGQANAVQLRSLDAAWLRNEGAKVVQFSNGKRATIYNGGILFHR
ncbi:MAG: tRNA(Ile)-lysidine synthase [Desulfovibrio sp.]